MLWYVSLRRWTTACSASQAYTTSKRPGSRDPDLQDSIRSFRPPFRKPMLPLHILGSPVVPFCPFYLGVSLLKPNIGKKCTLIMKGLLGNLVSAKHIALSAVGSWSKFKGLQALWRFVLLAAWFSVVCNHTIASIFDTVTVRYCKKVVEDTFVGVIPRGASNEIYFLQPTFLKRTDGTLRMRSQAIAAHRPWLVITTFLACHLTGEPEVGVRISQGVDISEQIVRVQMEACCRRGDWCKMASRCDG